MLINPIMFENFASFNCTTVGRSSDLMMAPPQSVSDGRRLIINVCGRAHRGHDCGFLVFWLQIATEPFALFHLTVFDCDASQIKKKTSNADRTYTCICIFNLELH